MNKTSHRTSLRTTLHVIASVAKQSIFIILFCINILGVFSQKTPLPALPNFLFYTANNAIFTHNTLPANKPTMIMRFDPDCDHCQKQATMIKENAALFKDCQFLWVSFSPNPVQVLGFQKKYFDNVPVTAYFVIDKDFKFDTYFTDMGDSPPQIFLYNTERKFLKYYKQETPAAELATYLK